MTLTQSIITVAAVVLGTMLTRFLPFLVFPSHKPTPPYLQYLGKVLPFSVIGLLIVYCLKSTVVFSFPFGFPEGIAILLVIAVHLWKKNMLLSIGAGTVVYMLLVQCVFTG